MRYHGFRPELRRTVAEVELPRPTTLFPLARTQMTVAKGAIADVLVASLLLRTTDES